MSTPLLFVTYTVSPALPSTLTEEELGALPFLDSQMALGGGTTPMSNTRLLATIGWHGTALDSSNPSFATVKAGGSLADYLGERVLLTCDDGSVAVYVNNIDEIAEDISITRRAFLAVGNLALDDLSGIVEVLA